MVFDKEWADAYGEALKRRDASALHLRRAAALGSTHALLDLAERRDDPTCFHAAAVEPSADPRRVAELAYRFDPEHVQPWLTMAAEVGDVCAMRTLIEEFEHNDLQRCWTWLHLARLLGTDLTESKMRAYHDGGLYDGRPYDDDQGGPLYVDGIEGVELESIDSHKERLAVAQAQRLFSKLQETLQERPSRLQGTRP